MGKLLNVTVSKSKSGRYYASLTLEQDVPEPPAKPTSEVGLDLGLKSFAALSNGEKVEAPRWLRQAEQPMKRLQRQLARQQIGGRNREKTRQKLARQHEKVAARRADFLHQLSTRLARQHTLIGVETLNVRGLLANHHLAKSIQDASWSEFVRQLGYKGAWYGCRVERAGKFDATSQTCSACGQKTPLTLAERAWTCRACGTHHDRDLNAAQNLLAIARERLARSSITPAESTPTGFCPAVLNEAGTGQVELGAG
jgi:putative transposase